MKYSDIKKQTVSLFFPSSVSLFNERLFSVFQVLLASFCIGLFAQIKIPLFFTPVPFTLSTIAILCVGLLLGKKKGALAVVCYLLEGSIGLPVFAGGNSGIFYLMGPTGGYLLGWVLQAYCIGWCAEKYGILSFQKLMLVFIASIVLQLSLGSLWLSQFVGLDGCLAMGLYPFLLVDTIKAFFVALSINYGRR